MFSIMETNNNTTPNNTNINAGQNHNQKIVNWSEYNQALIRRGNITIYISEAIAKKAFLRPKPSHLAGHPLEYRDDLILLILTIRELLRLPLRQTIGFVTGLLSGMGLNWPLPDYSTLSRRMGKLNVNFCHKFQGQNIVMLLDSSGFKVFGEGEWKVRKHGLSYRRTWRVTHIAVDFASRNIVGLVNTKADVHDNTQFKPLLDTVIRQHGLRAIKEVIGDGAYDANSNYLMARELDIGFIAPLRKDATEHINMFHYQIYDQPNWAERNAVVRKCEELGVAGWKKTVGYHRRSLVENAFSRLKTIFSPNLKSRTEPTQYTEQCIRASLINRFNDMGLPQYAT